jgi:hypothetical protein
MKLYAVCTLHETGWGTRTGIADPATATQALQDQNDREAASRNEKYGGPEREDLELGGFGGRQKAA